MRKRKYNIHLNDIERAELNTLVRKGEAKARTLARCRILLLADKGEDNTQIAHSLGISQVMVIDIKKRYLESGLKEAINERPRPGAKPKLSAKDRARITAIACSTPPEGHSHWTLQLLADKVVELDMTDSMTAAGMYKVLKKTNCNRT